MWRARIVPRTLVLVALCLTLSIGAALAKPAITAVRLGVHPEKTRLVLEFSEEPSYRIFTLPDPARVVIDLPELDWRVEQESLPPTQGLVSALRYGLFAPGASRIVLDITRPIGVQNVLVLPPREGSGHRLVVDLQAITAEAFADPARRATFTSRRPLPAPRAPTGPVLPPEVEQDGETPIIVVDAGHGGVDPGAIGASGTNEKTLALSYARELRRQLEASGFRVVMTRDKDVFLPLRQRFLIAQRAGAELFLSIHANTVKQNHVRGASVYTLSEKASDKEAAALARKENLSDILAGVTFTEHSEDVNKILIDLARRETMDLSWTFARTLVDELGQTVRLLRNTHRFAGFAVLKSPTVPSVLVEVGYISNAEEERLLRTDAHRQKVARSIVEAVEAYFGWLDGVRRS